MNSVTRMLCVVLVLSFLGSVVCVADAAPWFTWGQAKTQEEKAREAEKLEEQREAAARVKREAAAKAKAAREEKARLAKLNAEAKKQAKAGSAEAKSEKKAKLAEVEAKAKEQAKEIKAEKAALNSGLKQAKAEAKSEYKQRRAETEEENRAELEAEYKQQIAQLESEYKESINQVDNKAAVQSAQIELEKEQIEADYQDELAKINLKLRNSKNKLQPEQVVLPGDSTPRLKVKEIRISGNMLVPTAELLEDMPLIYNASNEPLFQAESEFLYDFKVLHDIILMPGQSREVSTRTIQGFTQYILSVYQEHNYAGVYVYVPTESLKDGAVLKDDILPINVLEATVTKVSVKSFDPDLNEKTTEEEKTYLRQSAVEEWSPVRTGEVTNKKDLDDFVNLLNLNPDRYVSAVISKGAEPGSLAVEYDVYEASPWHYFIQADNSGTKTRQWTPRVGLINTNLLGIDDTFTVMYQAPWEKGIEDDYALYGSYDFPLLGPRLRLNLFAGYSQFDDISADGGISFIGNGHFYGGTLRLNVLQKNDWFFDVTGTLMHERSKLTPSIFPQFLGSDVEMDMWGWGVDIHHRDDMSDTSLKFERLDSFSGSNATRFNLARTAADRNFSILTTSASHSQYLDPDKVQRASGSFRWITSDERLIPAKMTAFGGMYTVRGYDEYEIIADGGILASAQYEFDFVKYNEAREGTENQSEQLQARTEKPMLRKLAPLAFFDYGLAKVENPNPPGTGLTGEHKDQELCSVGGGVIVELGDNYSGVVYYGYPLISTDSTHTGKGRLHVGFLARW